jgi:hypothetical protein
MSFRRASLTIVALLTMSTSSIARGQERPLPNDVGPLPVPGAFLMQTCGETGVAWGWEVSANTNAGALDLGVDCPPSNRPPGYPTSFQQAGVWISDRLGNAGGDSEANAGDRAELVFSPSVGTSLVRMRYWRAVHKVADPGDHWLPYISLTSRSNVIDTCELAGQSTCTAGADDWFPNDVATTNRGAYRDIQGISANAIIVGLYCTPNPDDVCGNGNSLTRIDAEIFSAFLTISDPAAPTLGTPTGDGWTQAGWAQGALPLALASIDNTGIAATKVYADGSLVTTLQRSCSYDRPRPCSDEPVGAVGLPTAGLSDGVHAVSLSAVDAAGNETKVDRPQPLKVDNNAPAAPVGLVSPAPRSTENRFSVHWSLPADSGSPIVAARYQVCQAGVCGPVQTAPSLTGVDGLALPAEGEGSVRAWLVDELGHESPGGAAQMTINYAPQPASLPEPPSTATPLGPPSAPVPAGAPPTQTPGATPQPPSGGSPKKADPALKITALRVAGRRVTVRGRVSSRASGRLTVRFRARLRTGARLITTTARPRIKRRAFTATLVLPRALAHARSGTATVTYAGDADTRPASRRATVRWRG